MMCFNYLRLLYFLFLIGDFTTQKVLYLKCIFDRLPCQGDILNKFNDVTHKLCVTFQTVLWLFALKQTSDVVVIIFSGCLVTKKDYFKNFTALQETSFEQNNHLFFMSHTKKSSLDKRYKNTFCIITFLFANGFQPQDMQQTRDGMCGCKNGCKDYILLFILSFYTIYQFLVCDS